MHPPQPPYALATTEFRFRALAALAGRAPLGGEREAALGALMAARLAAGLLGQWPPALPQGVRARRAAAARLWFSSLTLQPALRNLAVRVIDASAGDDPVLLADALRALLGAATPYLDAPSAHELRALADALAPSAASDDTERAAERLTPRPAVERPQDRLVEPRA